MPQNSSGEGHRPESTLVLRAIPVCVCLVLCLIVAVEIAGFGQPQEEETREAKPQATEAPEAESRKTNADSESQPEFRTESIRGEVVWLADALKSEFGISTDLEAAKNSLAILTKDGQLFPIVENLRGRAFRKDERLRGKDTEILARRYDQQPFIQVLRICEIEDGKRYEVDYWCDVCAIVMYETGPCACCQDDNRLRKQLIKDDDMD